MHLSGFTVGYVVPDDGDDGSYLEFSAFIDRDRATPEVQFAFLCLVGQEAGSA